MRIGIRQFFGNTLFILLTSLSTCSNEDKTDNAKTVINNETSKTEQAKKTKAILKGKYSKKFEGYGDKELTIDFTDSNYTKEVIFEWEVVRRCKGYYSILDDKLIRTDRICQFLRSEEPREPEKTDDLITNIKILSDSVISIYLIADEQVADSNYWIEMTKVNQNK